MRWPDYLKARYAPDKTDREFSDILHEIESPLFMAIPKLLELDEKTQNDIVAYIYLLKQGGLH